MWTHSSENPLRGTATRRFMKTVLPRNKNVFSSFLPHLQYINRILRQLQPILDIPYLSSLFPLPPIVSYRQPPKLRKLLVHSKLPSIDDNNSVSPCNVRGCLCCQVMNNDTTIFTPSGKLYPIKSHFTCSSSDLVCMIRCFHCGPKGWYIGETGRILKQRIGEHRTSLNGPQSPRTPLPIPSHSLSPGQSYSSMTVSVLRGGLRDIVQRRITEQKLIRLFRTDENGLNRNMEFMSHYK